MNKPEKHTSEQIIDLAETLIQTRGYSAFSYQDIADTLKIRKASIHYHYPSKTDLGLAVLERYRSRFESALTEIGKDTNKSTRDLLTFYTTPYLQYATTPDRVCLCGALAGEMLALPKEMRVKVDAFFKAHQQWLASILTRGKKRGEVTLATTPAKTARLIFGALQGALLVKRTTGDVKQVQDVVDALKKQYLL